MKTIKQKCPKSCVAAVAAMATKTSVEAFERFCNYKEPPYSDLDFTRYLIQFKKIIGVGFNRVSNRNGVIIGSCAMDLSQYPAYVAVESPDPDSKLEHALYWDGSQIHDPSPAAEASKDPLSYKINGWFPIVDLK